MRCSICAIHVARHNVPLETRTEKLLVATSILSYRQQPVGNATEEENASKLERKFDYRYSRLLGVVFPGVYLAILSVFCLVYKIIPGPEFIALIFFIYAAYNKTTRRFIGDWGPFVFIFLSYEAMDGLVGNLSKTAHVIEPIAGDLRLFGSVPTLVLQQFCRTPFLDYLGTFLYSLHFIAPTVFGFILWKYYSGNFQRYTLALAIGTYSALITFLVYPVAPPWWGLTAAHGWYGVQATRILSQVDNGLGIPFYRTIIDYVSSNMFAAFPSLHVMFPCIISFYALKIKGKSALPILLFPIGVGFSAVYLGEHYVVDIIGGVVYATCAFLIVEKLVPHITPKLFHAQKSTQKEKPATREQ